jgi:hypothetical protein
VGSDDHRHLAGEADAVLDESLFSSVRSGGFERGQCRDSGAQHIHRVAGLRCLDDVVNRSGQFARLFEAGVESRQFGRLRQITVNQQIGHFLESRACGEVVDRIAAITEFSPGSVDETDARTVEIHSDKAAIDLDVFRHCLVLSG